MLVSYELLQCLQWLHTWFSSFFCCFASVSDAYCKCFNCFEHMLQMFSLNVVKVDLVLHMLQWDPSATVPAAAAGPVHIRVGVEGARAGYMQA
jgi:hypothetical protein